MASTVAGPAGCGRATSAHTGVSPAPTGSAGPSAQEGRPAESELITRAADCTRGDRNEYSGALAGTDRVRTGECVPVPARLEVDDGPGAGARGRLVGHEHAPGTATGPRHRADGHRPAPAGRQRLVARRRAVDDP